MNIGLNYIWIRHCHDTEYTWKTCSFMLLPQKSGIIFNIFVINPLLPNLIIIIIFYFENVTFFHAKLGSDVCPIVDSQTSGDT